MPYKDPERRKTYKHNWKQENRHRYKVENLTEEQRICNNQRMQNRGLPHKRVYTDGGGVWRCFLCGAERDDGVELHIHHKDQDRRNNDFSNLVCLCERCHLGIVHSKWSNITIPALVQSGIVDWQGNILVTAAEADDNKQH